MRRRSWRRCAVLALTVGFPSLLAAQERLPPAGARPGSGAPTVAGRHRHEPVSLGPSGAPAPALLWPGGAAPAGDGRLPRWVRWGMVGTAAGAVTLPLLGSLASDTEARPARAAVAGAVGGFVLIGGSVALWDALCRGPTRSRRAGLCGRP